MGTSTTGRLNPEQIQQIQQAIDRMANVGAGVTPVVRPFVFMAAFDGTNNHKSNLELSGDPHPTNVANLYELAEVNKSETFVPKYYPGVGTGGDNGGLVAAAIAPTEPIVKTAERALFDFATEARDYLQANPGATYADLSASATGFSRGGLTAVVFTQLLHERGLVLPDGTVVAPPGAVPVHGLALIDPVKTGVDLIPNIPPNVKGEVLMVAANLEDREHFKLVGFQDSRVVRVDFDNNHVGVGGGRDFQGTAAAVLEGVNGYLTQQGVPLAEVPEPMRFDGDQPVDIYTENFQTARNGDVLTNEDGSARLVWPVSGTPTLREVDPVPTFGSALTDHWSAAQLQAMQEGLSGTGLEVSGLGAYRQSDGSYLLTNTDGDVVGTVSEGPNHTAVLRTLDGQEVVTDALGQRWSEQELAQAQQATAALSLMNSMMALQQWGEMNDAQRLQSLAGLYNQIDGLQSGQLPGDLGQGVGVLGGAMGLYYGLRNDNALQTISGGVQLVNALSNGAASQAISSGLSSMGITGFPVGNVVPAINLLIALDNYKENPMGVVAAAVAFIPVYGAFLSVAISMVASAKDIPPSVGEASVQLDESGAVVVDTTVDKEGGGGTAAHWAQMLAGVAVGAGLSTPQAGAPSQHLPSVGYFYDPDGANLSNSNGHLILRWTDANGEARRLTYDSSGMRWDGNSVEGQSDIMRDYLLLMQSMEPQWPPVMYEQVAGGVLQRDYGVTTVLYATALGTFDHDEAQRQGGEADTDGGEAIVAVGSTNMVSLSHHTVDSRAQPASRVTLGADQIHTREAPSMGASTQGPRLAQGQNPIVFVPTPALTGGSRTVSAGMVQSLAQSQVFGQVSGTALALGLTGLALSTSSATAGVVNGPAPTHGDGQPSPAFDWAWASAQTPVDAPHPMGEHTGPGPLPEGSTPNQGGSLLMSTPMASETTPSGAVAWANLISNEPLGLTPTASAPSLAPSVVAATSPTADSSGVSAVLSNSSDTPLDFPTLVDDEVAGTEDETLVFSAADLLANDSTPNPVPRGASGDYFNGMKVVSVGSTEHGSVSVQGGQLVFVPNANYNGLVSFSYTVQDMYGMRQTGTARILVEAVNDLPEVLGESTTSQEDTDLRFTAASLLRNDRDIDGDEIFISRVGEAQGGVVDLLPDGTVRFVPTLNYNGPAAFTYWVSDGLEEVSASVDISVLQVNDLPVVQGEEVQSDEDVVLNFPFEVLLANDSDVDTDEALNQDERQTLTIAAVDNPQHGTVSIVDGHVRFTPELNYFGVASFDYWVDDGAGGRVSTTVVLNLAPVNDAPDVLGEEETLAEDQVRIYTQAELLANDSDVDHAHSDLRITQVGAAVNGSVELLADGRIRWVPLADHFGAASFEYLVEDGAGGQSVGQVALDLTPVNDAPRLQGESVEIDEDTVVTVSAADLLANDHDVDNEHADLVITQVGQAVNGQVAMDEAGQIIFTPHAHFYGQASYAYTVSDGVGGSSTSTVVLNYRSVNDLPVVNGEAVLGKRGVTYTFDDAALLANDTDVEHPNGLQIVSVGQAQNGEVTLLSNGDIRFTPAADYDAWPDAPYATFEYTVRDPDGGESLGQVVIDYATINQNPIATDDHFHGYEDVRLSINTSQLLSNDRDPDASAWSRLEVLEVAQASHGTVSLNNGVVNFDPTRDFYGRASFQYRVSDGEGGNTWATALIDVERENRAPVITGVDIFNGNDATFYYWSIPSGSDHNFLNLEYTHNVKVNDQSRTQGRIYAYDPDGDRLSFSISPVFQPGHGVVFINKRASIDAPSNIDHLQIQGRANLLPITDPSASDLWSGGRRNYLYDDYSSNGSNAYAGWQYMSWLGDSFTGPVSFSITVTDSRGLSTTSAPIMVQHVPFKATGGGFLPIVIDLDSNGLDLVAPDKSPMFFDVNDDGAREQIGWVASNDALLVFDKENDGRITSKDEISFVSYLPGAKTDLEGLVAFDTNGDGRLSSSDAAWQQFGFLQDANGNGVQDEGEFQTLDALGVSEIDLARQGQAQVVNGNVVFGTTTVQYTDGRTAIAGDVMFAERDAEFPDWVQAELVSSDVAPKLDVPTPSLEQQAHQFVQLASTQVSDTTPLAYVNIQDVSLSTGAVMVAADTEPQPVEVQTTSAQSTNDDLLVIAA